MAFGAIVQREFAVAAMRSERAKRGFQQRKMEKVYKYRGGPAEINKRDIDSIRECFFWAPTVDKLNDPAEALMTQGAADRLIKAIGDSEISERYSELIQLRRSRGIYSLSKTPLDELMWAYYGDGHKGFCIEYDLKRLVLEARNQWDIVEVNYAPTPPAMRIEDIVNAGNHKSILEKMTGSKSTRWAHEKELRIVTTRSGKNYYASSAITGIHFGLRCSKDLQISVRRSLSRRGYTYYQIKMIPESYQLDSEKIPFDEKLDGVAEPYLADIECSAIPKPEDLGKYQEHLPKIEKAVEIVRRDTSCKKIILADISASKSSDSAPQIFVQYETRVPVDLSSVLNRYFKIDDV